jgi:hypothetical protein
MQLAALLFYEFNKNFIRQIIGDAIRIGAMGGELPNGKRHGAAFTKYKMCFIKGVLPTPSILGQGIASLVNWKHQVNQNAMLTSRSV